MTGRHGRNDNKPLAVDADVSLVRCALDQPLSKAGRRDPSSAFASMTADCCAEGRTVIAAD